MMLQNMMLQNTMLSSTMATVRIVSKYTIGRLSKAFYHRAGEVDS